jgi:DNA invertase Pin-like site-specific DNA recombinase
MGSLIAKEKRGCTTSTISRLARKLDPYVSTKGDMGQIVMTVLGMVAQMERRFIKERQREGIDRAKALGR